MLEDDEEEEEIISAVDNAIVSPSLVVESSNGSSELMSAATNADIRSHVSLPSQEDINEAILEQKKRLLVDRFAPML